MAGGRITCFRCARFAWPEKRTLRPNLVTPERRRRSPLRAGVRDSPMPRDLPLGNGKLLVNFDRSYQMRDLFFPHVGMENHLTGHPCRFGVWVDGVFSWVGDDRWRRTLIYEPDATVTAVRLECDNPRIAIRVTDVVDFAVNLMVRKFVVERGSGRDVRLFLHHDFHIYGHPIGDTALYRPDLRAIVHYKDARYFLVGGRGA